MKLKHLIIFTCLLFYFPALSQPGDPGDDPDVSPISITPSPLNISLFQGDVEDRTLTIANNSGDNFSLSLSLKNTSHDTEEDEEFLIPPRLYSVDDFFGGSADERDPVTGFRINKIVLAKSTFGFAGIAFDGEFLYYSTNRNPGTIYKQIPQFKNNVVDSIFAPILATVRVSGLTYSGNHLYATSVGTNLIYQIDLTTGDLIDEIAMDGNGLGVAFGGNRGTIFAITSNTEIIEINLATKEIINRFPSPPRPKGIAYSNGVERLFVGEEFYAVYELDPDDGSEISYYEDFTAAMGADEGFGLKWLDFPSVTIDVPAQSSVQYELTFDASDLEPGLYNTTVQIAVNDEANSTVDLPVELRVSPIVEPLGVESFCTVASSGSNLWKIQNKNEFAVNATWKISGSGIENVIELQPGENVLSTLSTSEASDTLNIQWLDERNLQQEVIAISNNTVCDLRGLTASAVCTDNRDALRQWEIFNPNLFPVAVNWEVLGTEIGGSLEVENGITSLTTDASSAEESYTLQITWNTEDGEVKRQRKISSNAPCEIRGLVLTSVCTDDQEGRKKWEVFNQNAFGVEVIWEQEGTSLGDTILAPAGTSFFFSSALPENHIVKLTWFDEEGNPRRQRKSAEFGNCTEFSSFARVNAESQIMDEELTNNTISMYPNPFADNLSLKIPPTDIDDAPWSVVIYSTLGHKVYSINSGDIRGKSKIDINTASFPVGTYILMVDKNGTSEKALIIKK